VRMVQVSKYEGGCSKGERRAKMDLLDMTLRLPVAFCCNDARRVAFCDNHLGASLRLVRLPFRRALVCVCVEGLIQARRRSNARARARACIIGINSVDAFSHSPTNNTHTHKKNTNGRGCMLIVCHNEMYYLWNEVIETSRTSCESSLFRRRGASRNGDSHHIELRTRPQPFACLCALPTCLM
jgi:hypothetical protein